MQAEGWDDKSIHADTQQQHKHNLASRVPYRTCFFLKHLRRVPPVLCCQCIAVAVTLPWVGMLVRDQEHRPQAIHLIPNFDCRTGLMMFQLTSSRNKSCKLSTYTRVAYLDAPHVVVSLSVTVALLKWADLQTCLDPERVEGRHQKGQTPCSNLLP